MSKQQVKASASALPSHGSTWSGRPTTSSSNSNAGLLGSGAGGMGPSVTLISYKALASPTGTSAPVTSTNSAKPKSPYLARPVYLTPHAQHEVPRAGATAPARPQERPGTAPTPHARSG